MTTYIQHPKYTPKLCSKIFDLLYQGHSLHSAARICEISYRLLHKWTKDYPEFGELVQDGFDAAKGYFDQMSLENMENPKFNSTLYQLCRRNRFNDVDEGRVHIPGLSKAKTYTERCDVIRKAIGNGKISPGQAKTLIDTLVQEARVIEFAEQAKRIDALELIAHNR